ncbi:MAG: hypothetical protein HYS86_00885 [Candidatus Chisholmbacteria bacterium]|nr:hypothetical protein [Candidatus Chisholmbacteria bacterium]
MKVRGPRFKLVPIVAFVLLGVLALQIPFTKLLGADVRFTLFDLFAPIAGKLFAPVLGVFGVFIALLVDFLLHGASLTVGSLIRFFPTLFAVWYFGSRKHTSSLIAVAAIIAFNLHPIGRTVWFYSLFWTIPLIMSYFKNKHVLARALGSTFTAHAVGGALWIWAFNLPAATWISLIPIVILERSVFTLGIAGSYLLVTKIQAELKKQHLPGFLQAFFK